MSKKDVKRRYKGRIETVAAQATIVELVEAGYSHAMIYDILRDKGAVSVSYPPEYVKRYHLSSLPITNLRSRKSLADASLP